MESKVDYTASPPPYPAASSYPPAPDAAPGSTPYPTQVPQQYPPPSQYPPPAQPYPPATGPAPYGQPQGYVNPPAAAGYPPQPGYGSPPYVSAPPPQQSGQQQVLVVSATQPQAVVVQQVPSYVCHIVFACIVMWCCNWLFGLIAFILAAVASSTAVSDPGHARRLGHASIGLSIAGIVISVVIIIVVVAVYAGSSCTYAMYGTCYRYRSSSYYGYCDGTRVHGYCYYN